MPSTESEVSQTLNKYLLDEEKIWVKVLGKGNSKCKVTEAWNMLQGMKITILDWESEYKRDEKGKVRVTDGNQITMGLEF